MSPEQGPGAPDLQALTRLAVELAREAGALLLAALAGDGRRRLAEGAARKSSRTDLATEADQASERLVRARLAAARPDDAVLGEEQGETAGRSGLTWVVDPLDGTTNFVYGLPPWCVSIACARGSQTLVGVVHDPERDETFSAWRGGGARLGEEPLRLAGAAPLAECLVGTGFSYSAERRAAQALLLPRLLPSVRDLRRGGSAALDLCGVACGRLDAFYEEGLKPWDRAAGLLVAEEAGARALELDGLVPGAPTLVVAAPQRLDELAQLLRGAAPWPG